MPHPPRYAAGRASSVYPGVQSDRRDVGGSAKRGDTGLLCVHAAPFVCVNHGQARSLFLVAERDERVVGMIMVKDLSYVGQFFVAADVQGQGIGSALWAAALSRVQCERGATEFTVYASIAAEPVYRRFGFLPTGPATVQGGFHCVPMCRVAGVD
ncbi:GNAT family N-acetyltransferase [Ideonella paludis]|uniref:GNAT family N-acetyltransferase n=1 Tax=Ideonella paludis TaxID=1233411 RepID=UPI00363B3847